MITDNKVFSAAPNAAAEPVVIAKPNEKLGFASHWVTDHPFLPVAGR